MAAGRQSTGEDILLGRIGDVSVHIAETAQPWELEIDTLVVSVGPPGLGQLGAAVKVQFPDANWHAADNLEISPDNPALLSLPSANGPGSTSPLRRVVLATAREPDSSTASYREGPATLESVSRASASAVLHAAAQGARAVGLPLLGAGMIGLGPGDVAAVVLPAVFPVLETPHRQEIEKLVLVCRDERTKRAIQNAWSYHELLITARKRVVADPALLAEAAPAGLGPGDLSRLIEAENESELWKPCIGEYQELRRIDAEREDLRARLVATLDRERQVLRRDAAPGRVQGDRHSHLLVAMDQQVADALNGNAWWQELEKRRLTAADQLLSAVVRQSLLPRCRLAINRRLRDLARLEGVEGQRQRFRQPLRKVDIHGLRRQPDDSVLLTAAHAELEALIDPARSSSASVGVAGPRGCGKSTLLQTMYNGWTDRGVRILLPSPATYAPREFLLYLYDQICREVLAADPDITTAGSEERVRPGHLRSAGLLSLVLAPVLVLTIGITVLTVASARAPGDTGQTQLALGATVMTIAAVPLFLLLLLRRASPRPPTGIEPPIHPQVSALLVRDRLGWRLPGAQRLLVTAMICGGALLLPPAGILTARRTAGLLLLVVVGGTAVFRRRWSRTQGIASTPEHEGLLPFLRAGRAFSLVAALAAAQVTAGTAGLALLGWPSAAASPTWPMILGGVITVSGCTALLTGLRWLAVLDEEMAARVAPPTDPVSRRALRELARIRYQTSVVSGWTSSAKLTAGAWIPVGIDAGASGSTTEADLPLGVPDIVDGIKRLLPARGPALVAIDELDKIESVDQARNFLNEIKGILDARNTYFLVSMSEDAIAKFERRGLPFRDVFDSAFDEIVRVPYLVSGQALALLDRRITNVPAPFLQFAYCQSGGLPRDLLRAMERMFSAAAIPGQNYTLAAIAWEVIHRDLAGKTQAVTAAIKSIVIEPEVSTILGCFQNLDSCAPAGPWRTPCFMDPGWLSAAEKLDPVIIGDSSDLAQRRELIRLSAELLGYFYYCRTLLELFDVTDDDAVDRLIRAVNNDDGRPLDNLARARQTFAVNPFVAWEYLTGTRRELGLDVFGLPAPLTGGIGRGVNTP